jgi:predicted aspartyl protease
MRLRNIVRGHWLLVGAALLCAARVAPAGDAPPPAPAPDVALATPLTSAPPASAPVPAPPAATPAEELSEVVVEAPEPRYVAPTRRDRIGRIWAPVYINGRGPFRLVLDTGASNSAVNARVAEELGLPLLDDHPIMLRGVTGSRRVPTIPVKSLVVGDLELQSRRLPIVTDALGGAEGVLGTEGLLDKRILIDFGKDRIKISKSHYERAAPDFQVVPFQIVGGLLMVVNARIGNVPVKAIVDTGGQATLGNIALREALLRHYRERGVKPDEITGATLDVQRGDRMSAPPISLGFLTLRGVNVTFGDMFIFQHWHMTQDPTLLIGMDLLGLVDTLIIDYRLHELQVRLRSY